MEQNQLTTTDYEAPWGNLQAWAAQTFSTELSQLAQPYCHLSLRSVRHQQEEEQTLGAHFMPAMC